MQQLRGVDLDDDLRLEVLARIHIEERVSRASEAEDASMAASPVGVDRVVERQVVAGDVVDDRLGLDLDELDAPEVRGIEGASPQFEKAISCHPATIEHMFDSCTSGAQRYEQRLGSFGSDRSIRGMHGSIAQGARRRRSGVRGPSRLDRVTEGILAPRGGRSLPGGRRPLHRRPRLWRRSRLRE